LLAHCQIPMPSVQCTTACSIVSHCVWFRLDLNNRRWHSLEAPDEAAFPLIKVVSGKRYELYSDGSLANVER
jgi:hypothetical protein